MQPSAIFKESERRFVTVMFVDMVGFTAMSETSDPEFITAMMNACFAMMEETIEKHGGTIDKFMGDCVMVLFGLPTAQEQAAINALNTAIEIKQRMEGFNNTQHLPNPLAVHVGINTGVVIAGVVGGSKRRDFTVMGDTVNFAARLEEVSLPGQILVGPATYQATRKWFRFKELPPVMLKGKSEPQPIYELLSEKITLYRALPPISRAVVSLLVGREGEIKLLHGIFSNATDGKGQIICLFGEAGIGKTRLIAECKTNPVLNSFNILEGRALSMGKNLSYHPFIDLFRQWAAISEEETEPEAFQRLVYAIRTAMAGEADDAIPFIATLMGLKLPAPFCGRLKGIKGAALETLIFKSVRQLFCRLCGQNPLLIIMEDFHWADGTSVDLLISLFPIAQTLPVIFLNLLRPRHTETGERIAGLLRERFNSHYSEINLQPLSQHGGSLLIKNLMPQAELPPDLCRRILTRAGGNPYFIEEVLRSFQDTGEVSLQNAYRASSQAWEDIAIPQTIHDVIMARIDHLDEHTRRLLRTASVIGKSFFYRILEIVAEDTSGMDQSLQKLLQTEFIKERERMKETEYFFRHALAQETAYDSILMSTKKELHRRIAQAIEMLFPERLNEFYGMLSYHYSCGDDPEKAEKFMIKAGEEAMKAAASNEALHYYRESLKRYLAKQGAVADPLAVAALEKNIAFSFYNKGRHAEAYEYFQKALSRHGHRRSSAAPARAYRLFNCLCRLILSIYCPWFFWRKSPSGKDTEIINLYYYKAAALSNLDPRGFFEESLAFSKLLARFDLTQIPGGVGMLMGFSIVFSWPATSFRLSRKILAFVQNKLDPLDEKDRLTYELAVLFPDYYDGKWNKTYDHQLVESGLKMGEIMLVAPYIVFHGRIRLEQGDYAGARQLVGKLSEIHQLFNHAFVRALKYYLNVKLLLKYRKLSAALLEADEGLAFTSATDFKQIRMVLSAFRTRILILMNNLKDAGSAMEQTEQFKSELQHVSPPYLSNYLTTCFLADLAQLRQVLQKGDSNTINTFTRQTIRMSKQITTMAARLAYERTETFRLIGSLFYLTRQYHKAKKWLLKSIAEGKRLNARIELSRTYLVVGEYLSRMENRSETLDGLSSMNYMEMAREMFREMDLQWDLDQIGNGW